MPEFFPCYFPVPWFLHKPLNTKAIVTLIAADAARFSLFSSCSLRRHAADPPFDETLEG